MPRPTLFSTVLATAATLMLGLCSAGAQEVQPGLLSAGGVLDNANPDLVLTIGGGIGLSPAYPGSDELEWGPSGRFRLDFVRLPGGFTFGSFGSVGFEEGWKVLGSGNYVAAREARDHDSLTGLDDIDRTLELGFGVGYEQDQFRTFAVARYGFFGHEAFVGQIGADVITRPVEGLTLTLGPRVDFGDDKYVETYFGISPAEAAASGYNAYATSGGVTSAGVQLRAIYQFNPLWGVEGNLAWNRLLNDAADSPITRAGSEDQLEISLNLIRRISLRF